MSQIVLGIGTSHSPLLAIPPERWAERAADDCKRPTFPLADGRSITYEQLAAETGNRYAAVATLEHFIPLAARAQANLDRLAEALKAARPDLVVIVGDDQDELFLLEHMPAVAIYYGDTIVMQPRAEARPQIPAWHRACLPVYRQDAALRHPGAPGYARAVIEGLLDHGIDVGGSIGVPEPVRAGFGHAFGFVLQRLLRNRPVPVLPVLLNTYFRPNVPRAWRCHDIGRALAQVIAAQPDTRRVAIVASGGLSHFATDEALDLGVLHALRDGDAAALRALPVAALRSGSSEILNWVLAGGALAALRRTWLDYLPVYRTPAGTGIGLGFMLWQA